MKQGFILLEILISILIASVVSGALFTSFFQVNRIARVTDDLIDISSKSALIYNQFAKDIAGICIPVNAQQKESKPKQETPLKKQLKKETSQEETEKPKPITKLFYATERNGMLDILTFITCNPLTIYWGDQAGKAKPRIARIVYRLKKEKDKKDSYVLTRQESYVLDFDAFKEGGKKSIRAVSLITDIKSCALEYVMVSEKEDDKGELHKEYKKVKQWKDDPQKEKENEKEQQIAFVIFKLELWNAKHDRVTDVSFKVAVLANTDHAKRKIKKRKKKKASKAVKNKNNIVSAQQRTLPQAKNSRLAYKPFSKRKKMPVRHHPLFGIGA